MHQCRERGRRFPRTHRAIIPHLAPGCLNLQDELANGNGCSSSGGHFQSFREACLGFPDPLMEEVGHSALGR